MEDEDFGFTRRKDNALKKVLVVNNEYTDDAAKLRNDEQRICSPPKVGSSQRSFMERNLIASIDNQNLT